MSRLVISDEVFANCRQVKVQPEGCRHYDHARLVIAWSVSLPGVSFVSYMPHFGGNGSRHYRRKDYDVPPPELVAFVAGTMPAPVFADWLEEQGVDLGDDAFAILRGWVTRENTACD